MSQRVIWKYPLELLDRQTVSMPKGAEILSAQVQGKDLCLWAFVDPDAPKELREIGIIGTGHLIENTARHYVDTVQMGSFVWHVFEYEVG